MTQKFDEHATVPPFCFVGAIARSKDVILKMSIDKMVDNASCVTRLEALHVWGLPAKSYDALKSHSATDVSESAFKYFGGDIKRFQQVVGADVWSQWIHTADEATGTIQVELIELEAEYALKETRKVDISHALFHLGKAKDIQGQIRTAIIYKSTLLVSKAAKHYIETGNGLSGQAVTAVEAAVDAAKKDVPSKRKRPTPSSHRLELCNVRQTMLCAQLQENNLELDESTEERGFIERGPAGVSKIMSAISDIIQKRLANGSNE